MIKMLGEEVPGWVVFFAMMAFIYVGSLWHSQAKYEQRLRETTEERLKACEETSEIRRQTAERNAEIAESVVADSEERAP